MPFKHGKNTNVYLGVRDFSTYLNATDFGADVDMGETSTYTAAWKTFLAGQSGAKIGFGGLYDPTILDLPPLLAVDPNSVLTYAPAGAVAIGDRARLVQVALTGYAESSPVGGIVAVKWGVLASGPVGWADMLHLATADAGTTTGATKDDLAATATGWIAHIHVLAVTGAPTSWQVKLQDASASNFSDGADVAGGAFTTSATTFAQRLISATPTTALRRYVRYVATVVGGAAPTITFALAYSRNSS